MLGNDISLSKVVKLSYMEGFYFWHATRLFVCPLREIAHVKFNVHCSYAEQVIVLKVADRRTDGRTRLVTTIGISQNFGWGLKKGKVFFYTNS